MILSQWAARWGVSAEALVDLRRALGSVPTEPAGADPGDESEAAIQTRIRLEASRLGCRLWRNNVGATYTEDGAFLRYGLANDSKQLNERVKSSDLIGIRSVVVTPGHVGQTFGVFVAREVKAAGWRYTGTKREKAQLAFLELVTALGGDAAFANKEGTLDSGINNA